MNKKLWLNGALLAYDVARIDPRDRGFTLGDGLFETIRVRQGAILRLSRHLARLRNGASVLALALQWTDAEIENAILNTLKTNLLKNAVVRLTVSRGVPKVRGLLPDPNAENPTMVVQAESFTGYPVALYQHGVHAVTSTVRRNESSPLANIKSLNYLDNILARQEAAAQGADDALLLNTKGNIVCASAANIFFVQNDVLFTPPLHDGALPGTMREHLLKELAPEYGLNVVERSVSPNKISQMDEAFLTNALMGVMPLAKIDNFLINAGDPGNLTLALMAILERQDLRGNDVA